MESMKTTSQLWESNLEAADSFELDRLQKEMQQPLLKSSDTLKKSENSNLVTLKEDFPSKKNPGVLDTQSNYSNSNERLVLGELKNSIFKSKKGISYERQVEVSRENGKKFYKLDLENKVEFESSQYLEQNSNTISQAVPTTMTLTSLKSLSEEIEEKIAAAFEGLTDDECLDQVVDLTDLLKNETLPAEHFANSRRKRTSGAQKQAESAEKLNNDDLPEVEQMHLQYLDLDTLNYFQVSEPDDLPYKQWDEELEVVSKTFDWEALFPNPVELEKSEQEANNQAGHGLKVEIEVEHERPESPEYLPQRPKGTTFNGSGFEPSSSSDESSEVDSSISTGFSNTF